MKITRTPRSLLAAVMALAVVASACSTTTTDTDTGADGDTTIKLQLQWFKQGQFAGYLAAVDQGFYAEQGLNVEILDGGTDIVPQTVLAQGQADYAVAWVPKALASREAGAGITDVARSIRSRAPCRSRSRIRTSRHPPTSRARPSETGATETNSSCSPV
nr:ABC transporter substrate-binding protein [Rhodococcus sp. BS-15]